MRLNGTLARPTVATLHEQEEWLTADGSRVVYKGDLEAEDVVELYVSPTDGSGGATRLNGPLVEGGDVFEFQLTADGTYVVYRADQERDGVSELFAVPLDGGRAPVRLNGRLAQGRAVTSFSIRPDGKWVAYVADQRVEDVDELFAVPIDRSSPPVLVNVPLIARGDVRDFRFSPDGERLVYLADHAADSRFELFSVRLGEASIRLNPPFLPGQSVLFPPRSFDFSPDGSRVLYLADHERHDVVELHSVPIDGSAPAVRLHGPLFSGSVAKSFVVTPDGAQVVYVADEHPPFGCEVSVAPIDGSAPSRKLGVLLSTSNTVPIAVDSTSTRVVYLGPGDDLQVRELYSAPLDGSAPAVRLHPGLVSGGVHEFTLAGDGRHVAFRMQEGWAAVAELFAAPLDGSRLPWRLNPELPAGSEVPPGILGVPRSDRVLFVADPAGPDVMELFSVPIDASGPVQRLSNAMTLGGDVQSWQASSDGRMVLYRADQELDDVVELFAAPVDASAPAVRVNDPLRPGPVVGDVGSFALSPDGRTAVYGARQDGDDVAGVYSVPIDRSRPPVALHPDLPDGVYASALALAVTPDGMDVVFARVEFVSLRVYVAPLDGSRAPELLVEIFGPPPSAVLELSADGRWGLLVRPGGQRATLFRLDGSVPLLHWSGTLAPAFDPGSQFLVDMRRTSADDFGLFSVRLDGTGTSVRLDALPVGRSVVSTAITPDGASVLYVADQDVEGRFDLYRVPIDGSAPPIRLSAGAVGSGVSVGLEPTLDSLDVLYRQETAAGFRLLRAAVDGSGTPLELASSAVNAKELARSGRLVFLDDGGLATPPRLFSVPADASAAPLDLSGPLTPGGAITSFALSDDGAWAVYLADPEVPGRRALFAVPLDGSAPPIRIAVPAEGSQVLDHAIAPDSTRVAYRVEGPDGAIRLLCVPIDGSCPPIRVDDSGGDASEVTAFAFAAGQTFVYRGDLEQDGVFELFAGTGRHEARPPVTPVRGRTRTP